MRERTGGTTSHLNRNNSTEWSSTRWVSDLDEADVGLSGNGTRACHVSWHADGDRVVLVNVGGTLDDAHLYEHARNEAALLGCGNVTLCTWHLGGDGSLFALRECTSSSRVDDYNELVFVRRARAERMKRSSGVPTQQNQGGQTKKRVGYWQYMGRHRQW